MFIITHIKLLNRRPKLLRTQLKKILKSHSTTKANLELNHPNMYVKALESTNKNGKFDGSSIGPLTNLIKAEKKSVSIER